MIFRTHLAFCLLICLLIYNYFSLDILFIPAALFAAGFPDIDNPGSKYGKKLGIISKLINLIFRHRGIFHSLFFGVIISLILFFIEDIYGIGFFLGFLSHLIGDSLTKQGINFLYPFGGLKLKGFIQTGGFAEIMLFYVFLISDVFLIWIRI